MNSSVMMRLKVIRSITIIISHTQILLYSHNKHLSITVENQDVSELLPRQSYAKPQTLPFWRKKERKKRKMQRGNRGRGKGKTHGVLLRLKHQV